MRSRATTCFALGLALASRAGAQDLPLVVYDEVQRAYELRDLERYPLTMRVGVGVPEFPRVGVEYLLAPGVGVEVDASYAVVFSSASIHASYYLLDGLGFRPFVAAGVLGYLFTPTSSREAERALCPALRVGFENRGLKGESFRLELGAAYDPASLGLGPVLPILAVSRGFALD
jgi:hypothetical protein